MATILCIDDERTGLLVRKLMLEGNGHRVLIAETGEAGLAMLASSPVDMVILDYQMPEMDGAAVATEIRQRWPSMPIVLLSGYPEQVPQQALNLVQCTVTKGGPAEKLLFTVDQALNPVPAKTVTVLNVDDNAVHRYAVTRVLEHAGFQVVEARSGVEALSAASLHPSVIILDINLPDMLGFEVCRRLKQDPSTRDIPVIHISATSPGEAAATQSIESGANVFVKYPSDMREILHLIRRELRRPA
jgi:CheY-like chemotaxis protein